MEFVLWKVERNHNRISSHTDSFCLIKDKKQKHSWCWTDDRHRFAAENANSD